MPGMYNVPGLLFFFEKQKEKILVIKMLCVYLQCQTTKDPTV